MLIFNPEGMSLFPIYFVFYDGTFIKKKIITKIKIILLLFANMIAAAI